MADSYLNVCNYLSDYVVSSKKYGRNFYNTVIDPAAQHFYELRYRSAMSNMKSNLNTSQIESLIANNGNTKEVAEVIDDLVSSNPYILEDIMNKIAESLNESMARSAANADLQSIQSTARSYQSMLSEGAASKETAEGFLNQVNLALQTIGASGLPQSVYNAFVGIFTGQSTKLVPVSLGQTEAVRKVIRYLNSAASKIPTGEHGAVGTLSTQSFGGTISNIFNRLAGEPMTQELVSRSLRKARKEVLDTLDNARLGSYIKKVSSGRNYSELVGEQTDNSNTQIKTDILNTSILKLQAELNGAQITVNLTGNASVKWGTQASIKLVNDTPMTSILTTHMDNVYAHNVLAHNGAAAPILRKSVAASFFTDWLAGSGQIYSYGKNNSKTASDSVQFLIINNKVYSVYDIVNRVLEKYDGGEKTGVGVTFNGIGAVKNTWVGQGNDVELAKQRSEDAKNAINSIVISANLNKNILGLT